MKVKNRNILTFKICNGSNYYAWFHMDKTEIRSFPGTFKDCTKTVQGHVRWIDILTWHWGFQEKNLHGRVLFSLYTSLFWELRDKRNFILQFWLKVWKQMWVETANDNCQTPAWISHDLTRNDELAFSPTTNPQFYRFQILKLFFLYFSLFISKE